MINRRKLLATLAAGVLTLGVTGIALAENLKTYDPLISVDASGTVTGFGSGQGELSCDGFTGDLAVGAGQVGFHFVLSPTNANSGNLTANFSTGSVGPVASSKGAGSELQWFVVVDYPVTLNSATTDVDDTNDHVDGLKVSHMCVGAPVTPTPTPTFGPTPTPTFGLQTGDITNAPSEPSTDSIGANGTSAPADGAWLLVVALGVLLASIVVLTPARAKSRR